MKRSTCKVLIGIALGIIVLFIIGFATSPLTFFAIFFVGGIIIVWAVIILFIVAWWGWNSEERKARKEELRIAQLKALRRGRVNVDLKGKMRKLK